MNKFGTASPATWQGPKFPRRARSGAGLLGSSGWSRGLPGLEPRLQGVEPGVLGRSRARRGGAGLTRGGAGLTRGGAGLLGVEPGSSGWSRAVTVRPASERCAPSCPASLTAGTSARSCGISQITSRRSCATPAAKAASSCCVRSGGVSGAAPSRRSPSCPSHIVALLAVGTSSTMAQTGVSEPVVVDGERFLDALFASAGQG